MNGKKSVNHDELDLFKVSEVKYRPTPFWSQVLLLAISGSVFFGFIYACISRIDEVVIARGELQAIGVEDYLTEENTITLVEWPEKSKRYFNNPDYIIELNHCDNDEKRLINIIKDPRQ